MIMNKDVFEKSAFIDGIRSIPANVGPGYKWINGTNYIIPNNDKFTGIRMASIREYPDKYSMSINYFNSSQNISLDFDTEDEAYSMLYRFLYMPETIDYKDLFEEHSEEQLTNEEVKDALTELDKTVLESDECSKGEKLLYRFLSFITKKVLSK